MSQTLVLAQLILMSMRRHIPTITSSSLSLSFLAMESKTNQTPQKGIFIKEQNFILQFPFTRYILTEGDLIRVFNSRAVCEMRSHWETQRETSCMWLSDDDIWDIYATYLHLDCDSTLRGVMLYKIQWTHDTILHPSSPLKYCLRELHSQQICQQPPFCGSHAIPISVLFLFLNPFSSGSLSFSCHSDLSSGLKGLDLA